MFYFCFHFNYFFVSIAIKIHIISFYLFGTESKLELCHEKFLQMHLLLSHFDIFIRCQKNFDKNLGRTEGRKKRRLERGALAKNLSEYNASQSS